MSIKMRLRHIILLASSKGLRDLLQYFRQLFRRRNIIPLPQELPVSAKHKNSKLGRLAFQLRRDRAIEIGDRENIATRVLLNLSGSVTLL